MIRVVEFLARGGPGRPMRREEEVEEEVKYCTFKTGSCSDDGGW